MENIKTQLDEQYVALQNKIDELDAGECKAPDVKKLSSLLGIYKERDGSYMCRVRRTAGETTSEELRHIADVMEQCEVGHAHFSTRQNVQLHGVPGTNVLKLLRSFADRGMAFRGGGGNTFRNVSVSPLSGIAADTIFDTTTHGRAVWDWVYNYEKAFQFCRKFKLSFASEESDIINAGIMDLGFIARVKDGQRGFKVYGGGGQGRGASLGIVLIDFLPEKDIIRASQAMIDVFYDHGNREERAKARLRFVCQELGEEKFRELFLSYYEKADAPDYESEIRDYSPYVAGLKKFDTSATDATYESWKARAVEDTLFDEVKAVRLFIRNGNFSFADLRSLADILDTVGAPFIRISILQDAYLALVHESALPEVYRLVGEKLPEQQALGNNFEKHITRCIGAASCPIGILKAPEAAVTVAASLDALFENYQDSYDEVYNEILDGINISGCASSCGLNQVAGIGYNGLKKRIDGAPKEVYQLHIGGQIDEVQHLLAKTDEEWLVPAETVGEYTAAIVKEFLDTYKTEKISFREYMVNQRESFDFAKFL